MTTSAEAPISVAIADDEARFLSALADLLAGFDDLFVVGTAQNGAELVELVEWTQPAVAIVDVQMPVMDGVSAIREMSRRGLLGPGRTRALMHTVYVGDRLVAAAMQAGADSYVLKGAQAGELADAVRATARGDRRLAQAAIDAMVRLVGGAPPVEAETLDRPLTAAEVDVVELIAQGLTVDEIARRLHLSPNTIKTHETSARAKTGCSNRTKLAVWALRNGLGGDPTGA
ncbi:MAG: response regulator transcription factor [Microthrixaceae bacterium]|jgi:DNA-binding NarL/FixJ family response regulator|nr:response regulator transcription factor [Microthrixaceae bacterium]HMT60682.1 response regulator transcription factor [Microthrixaceae bacterium]